MSAASTKWTRRLASGDLAALLLLASVVVVVFKTDALLSSLDVGPLGTEAEARTFVGVVAAFHGEPRAWFKQPELQIHGRGKVPFTRARLAFGLDHAEAELVLRYVPGTHAKYEYLLLEGGDVKQGRVDTSKDRDGRGLLLDSIRHLFGLPFSVASIPFRRGLVPARSQARAFFTWGNDAVATSEYDQIVWSHDASPLALPSR